MPAVRTYEIKVYYGPASWAIVTITGKDLPDAFYRFHKKELKALRTVTGFNINIDKK